MFVRCVVVAAVALLAASCGGSADDAPQAGPTPSPAPPPGLQQYIEDGRALVAEESGVPIDDVELVQAAEATWSDGALGCPDADQVYTQALVEGFQIEFEADGETYYVHGELEGDAFVCDEPAEGPLVTDDGTS